ncbi:hypothetical protein DQ04_00411030 [Trypanosoma grayi]|uniref:hypothetical protein n=1 Tax=Trypanosoma grayi TaxID=71804 RepID=UPI0004F4070C|nr:hypothetical protein DQ04_00411030 [Trypanosoma grayi]KEG14539.1 hypothetical protein DQ04_00411030 [Trypanosoma grayi]
MALLRVDAEVELLTDVGAKPVREQLQAVEFVVRNAKTSIAWPLPSGQQELSMAGDVTLGEAVGEVERLLGPSLLFHAPLGGQLSKEFRALVRRGLARVLTNLVLQQLHDTERQANARVGDVTEEEDVGSSSVAAQYVSIEKRAHNTEVARVHWSPQLLQHLLLRTASDALHFTASLPMAATLIPLIEDLEAASLTHGSGTIDRPDVHRTCRLAFAFKRLDVVRQSLHDEHNADRLGAFLYHSYLKPAEQMREAGGESLQPPLLQLRDAADCYQRALGLAQAGLRYPYRHVLQPPPSLEDREANAADDDMDDECAALIGGERDIAPANRYLNLLLGLQRGAAGAEEVECLYGDPLLANGRVVFPRAHALFHVWYALHRQVVVAAANAAHTLLLMQPSTTPGASCKGGGYVAKELQQRQVRVARWCVRVLSILQRLCGWCGDAVRHEADAPSDAEKELLWLYTIKFKILLRRAKLLRVAGALDESQKAYEEAEEQLRALSTRQQQLLGSVLQDVSSQLAREKTLLGDAVRQGGGLVLRL